jgi:hypothetical protein
MQLKDAKATFDQNDADAQKGVFLSQSSVSTLILTLCPTIEAGRIICDEVPHFLTVYSNVIESIFRFGFDILL